MNYYIEKDNKIVSFNTNKQILQNDFIVHPEYANLEIQQTNREIILLDNEFVFADEHQEEIAQKERERLNKLSLTKREVFLAIYKDKGITPEQIRSMLTSEEAKIEFDYANDYYRGNPLIGQLGEALGYTPTQLDVLFETGEIPPDVNKISEGDASDNSSKNAPSGDIESEV